MNHFDWGDGYFTSRQAADYLGFRSRDSAIRKAVMEGHLRPDWPQGWPGHAPFPAGRAGCVSTRTTSGYAPADGPGAPPAEGDAHGHEGEWKRQWNCWVAPTKLPGIWKRKEGGCLVRARVTDPTTGNKKEIRKVLPEADEVDALRWLTDERARIKAGLLLVVPPRTRFGDIRRIAVLEEGDNARRSKSARSRERWTESPSSTSSPERRAYPASGSSSSTESGSHRS